MKVKNTLKSRYRFSKNLTLEANEERHISLKQVVEDVKHVTFIERCVIAESDVEQKQLDKILGKVVVETDEKTKRRGRPPKVEDEPEIDG